MKRVMNGEAEEGQHHLSSLLNTIFYFFTVIPATLACAFLEVGFMYLLFSKRFFIYSDSCKAMPAASESEILLKMCWPDTVRMCNECFL